MGYEGKRLKVGLAEVIVGGSLLTLPVGTYLSYLSEREPVVPRTKMEQCLLEIQNTKALQTYLAIRGILPGPIDGKLGAETREAIADLQKRDRISVTGEPDQETVLSICTAIAK